MGAQVSGDIGPHPGYMGGQPGQFTNHRQVGIAHAPTQRANQFHDFPEHDPAIGACPLRVTGWEMLPDVALCGCAQDGIAQGVQSHVTIGCRNSAYTCPVKA